MNFNVDNVVSTLVCGVINLTIICGTTYLVFWKEASGWWYLLAAILLHSTKSSKD